MVVLKILPQEEMVDYKELVRLEMRYGHARVVKNLRWMWLARYV